MKLYRMVPYDPLTPSHNAHQSRNPPQGGNYQFHLTHARDSWHHPLLIWVSKNNKETSGYQIEYNSIIINLIDAM